MRLKAVLEVCFVMVSLDKIISNLMSSFVILVVHCAKTDLRQTPHLQLLEISLSYGVRVTKIYSQTAVSVGFTESRV